MLPYLLLIGAVLFLYYSCFRGGNGTGSSANTGSSSLSEGKKTGARTNKNCSNQFIVKEQRMKILLEKSKQRYLRLHPEYDIKSSGNSASSKPHIE
mmetsp:Transcript_17878/g.23398  ORF Transcript_17878/g.23398 Transcript_17878/m.23398 type:complete len:96 (-) Transcript_17878:1057-1344(-)